jgi:hypothetical protein
MLDFSNRMMTQSRYQRILLKLANSAPKKYKSKHLANVLVREVIDDPRNLKLDLDETVGKIWNLYQSFERRRFEQHTPESLDLRSVRDLKRLSSLANTMKVNNGMVYQHIIRSLLDCVKLKTKYFGVGKGDFRVHGQNVEVKLSGRERFSQVFDPAKAVKVIILRTLESKLRMQQAQAMGIQVVVTDQASRENFKHLGVISFTEYAAAA